MLTGGRMANKRMIYQDFFEDENLKMPDILRKNRLEMRMVKYQVMSGWFMNCQPYLGNPNVGNPHL
jgi:hypothetical protein